MENVCFMGNQNHKGVFFSHLLLPNSGGILGFSGGSLDMRKYSFAFFPIIDYVWSVPRWLDRHCTRHTCGTQLHSSPLKVKREIPYLLIFTLENRKTAQCTPNDPTKLICVTPSEWIRWYRRYDKLKPFLVCECVGEKMLAL